MPKSNVGVAFVYDPNGCGLMSPLKLGFFGLCLHKNQLAIEYLSFEFVTREQPFFILHPWLSSRYI